MLASMTAPRAAASVLSRRAFTTSSRVLSLSSLSAERAKDVEAKWRGTSTSGGNTKNYVNGQFVDSQTQKWIDINDPATQTLLSRAPDTTEQEFNTAVKAAEDAFPGWSETSLLGRQQIMFRLQALIRDHMDDIANSIVLEQGKTFADAKGDVLRGLQVVEVACGITSTLMDNRLEVAKDMDTYTRRFPLGVTAAICPFNFPAMIPLWTLPMATVTGNTLLLKPSERDPGASLIIAELAERAGLPKGVLNIVNGATDAVNRICDHPSIKAITFVGSDRAGAHIYNRGISNGKRVQANLGAKNHCVVMPDANKNLALNSITGAAFGAAGQRCMALSVAVLVGDAQKMIPDLVERAKALKVGQGFEKDTDLGPVISPAAREKVINLTGSVESEGGKILLDGRDYKNSEYPNGNFVGPSIVEVKPGMQAYETEIFGPTLAIVKVDTLDEAIELINKNKYGNGTALFSSSGATARAYEKRINIGQIGINTAVPVPLPMFSWSATKGSIHGQSPNFYGNSALNFFTSTKTITSLWREADATHTRASVDMPTMS
ncbi:unnamed protein product [Sympodiomycopsis kandeliae]